MVLNIIRRAYHGSECSADDLWTPSQKKFAGKSKCSALRPGKTLLIYPYCTRLLNLFCSPRSHGQQPQAFSVKQTALPSRRSLYLSRASRCVLPAQSETRQTLLFSLEISLDGCAALTRRCSVDGDPTKSGAVLDLDDGHGQQRQLQLAYVRVKAKAGGFGTAIAKRSGISWMSSIKCIMVKLCFKCILTGTRQMPRE